MVFLDFTFLLPSLSSAFSFLYSVLLAAAPVLYLLDVVPQEGSRLLLHPPFTARYRNIQICGSKRSSLSSILPISGSFSFSLNGNIERMRVCAEEGGES